VAAYLKQQLIAYLGNKRLLLPFLGRLFEQRASMNAGRRGVFLDPFAGSGAVARLARTLGFEVHANDWETYSWVINRAFLTLTPREAQDLFTSRGGLEKVLSELNALKEPREEVVALHYAPRETQNPRPGERLFYTRENALFLDAVRERLEDDYGPEMGDPKVLLLALLLYEASVHSNTSGVFKGFHAGYGGHSGDALTRILSPMQLEVPELWDSPFPAFAFCQDALEFVRRRSAEVCYLDPPYNQHQYGSNYHLLNTVARGDRPIAERVAGIRPDWKETRSPFCSRKTSSAALCSLLDAVDARTLVVSYNTEGVIDFEELHELLATRGRVTLEVQDYVVYRGGRQSPSRRAHNLEFALVVDTGARESGLSRARVERFLAEKRLVPLLKGRFHPQRLRSAFDGGGTDLQVAGRVLPTWKLYQISEVPNWASWLDVDLKALEVGLTASQFNAPNEEAEVLYSLLDQETSAPKRRALEVRLLQVLRRLAFAKYRTQLENALLQLEQHLARQPSPRLHNGLQSLRVLYSRRSAPLESELQFI
jgi:adenine-specific DNA-methyltransferase